MSDNEHPGERLLEFLKSIIARSQIGYNAGQPAKHLWCLALSINASNKVAFVQNVRLFQDLLDEWNRFNLSFDSSAVRQDYVNKVYAELSYTVLNLGELTAEDLLSTCHRLEATIGMGIYQVFPDVPWDEDGVATLKEEVEEWKRKVIESSIEHVWKLNIIEALDKVLDAIDNYDVKGPNNLTDALIRYNALVKCSKVAASLTNAGLSVASLDVDIVDRLGDSDPLMYVCGSD